MLTPPAPVALYFVASPLQYLAAKRVAAQFEQGGRQILIWYKQGVGAVVQEKDWDLAFYMPWPRWEPLPGPFGRHRRLRKNLQEVAQHLGRCQEIHLHSAVFDTEAINYFLRGLPKLTGAKTLVARILPDGLLSVRRYPLGPLKQAMQYMRKLRRIVAPELDYWCFSGDRIGSEAPFCVRIYTLAGLPHDYPKEKVVVLPPLVDVKPAAKDQTFKKALVIGQPLTDTGLLSLEDCQTVTEQIHLWLASQNIQHIEYKAHPKDPKRELFVQGDQPLDLTVPLEVWMSQTHYDAVVGVRSSALIFARQIYPHSTLVAAFGWHKIQFKSKEEAQDMRQAFEATGVIIQ